MAELRDFSPEQIEEARNWYLKNHEILSYDMFSEEVRNALYGAYFDLKVLSIELRPNQFVIGIDYKSSGNAEKNMEQAILGNIQFNLSFWNPHPKGVADQLAKDFLLAKLSTL